MEYKQYRRTQIAEMADWEPGCNMDGVSVSIPDFQNGSPKLGDKIARNPANHIDKWLVAKAYFETNFAPLAETPQAVNRKWAIEMAKVTGLGIDATPEETADQYANLFNSYQDLKAVNRKLVEANKSLFLELADMYDWDLRRNGVDGSYLNFHVNSIWQKFEALSEAALPQAAPTPEDLDMDSILGGKQ